MVLPNFTKLKKQLYLENLIFHQNYWLAGFLLDSVGPQLVHLLSLDPEKHKKHFMEKEETQRRATERSFISYRAALMFIIITVIGIGV